MYSLAIIGYGKMGSAIVKGLVLSKLYQKNDILIIVRREEQKLELEGQGYQVSLNIEDAYNNAESLLLAVKPQKFKEAFNTSCCNDFKEKSVFSIAAGVSLKELNSYFPGAEVIRAMPNTGAEIQKSVTTLCSYDTSSTSYNKALEIFKSIGKVVEIKEEEMDATLPLNGSMPAYLYYFISSFIKAAVESGIEESQAKELLINTIISSSTMLLTNNEPLDTLINNVCSKGGTTIAGLNQLTNSHMDLIIKDCYNACKNRSIELQKNK